MGMKDLIHFLQLVTILALLQSCKVASSSPINYAIDRLEAEIEAFEAFDRTARYRPDAVLFTGSSSIRFWPDLGDVMAPVPSINRGFGGSTLPEVNHYYDRIITKFRPSVIVLYCGENDLWIGRSTEDVVLDYQAFVKKTKEELPNTKIIYLSMKPSPARWEKWDLYQQGNRLIQKIIDKDPEQFYLDISTYMFDESGKPNPTIFIKDMLHMNKQGYAGWQKIVQPFITEIYQ